MGALNADRTFDRFDIELLQKWLLTAPGTALSDPKAADFSADEQLRSAQMTAWNFGLSDYGEDHLYLPYGRNRRCGYDDVSN